MDLLDWTILKIDFFVCLFLDEILLKVNRALCVKDVGHPGQGEGQGVEHFIDCIYSSLTAMRQ